LPYFLANLEIARFGRRFDEIAFAVDIEQPGHLALDLAADQEIRVGVDVVLLHIRAVARFHLAQRITEEARDLEHRCRGPQIDLPVGGPRLLFERVDRILRH
jgi:hypothetical protein